MWIIAKIIHDNQHELNKLRYIMKYSAMTMHAQGDNTPKNNQVTFDT